MPEECTSSSHDKKQLEVKVFLAEFDLMKVTRPITLSLSLSNHVDGSFFLNKHVMTTNGGK